MELETAEQWYARVRAAADESGRLPVAVEQMPGWDIYPYETDSLRMRPLQPLVDEEPPRSGEDPADCWCAPPDDELERAVWRNERWMLRLVEPTSLPVALLLSPLEHCDLPTVPRALAAEMGQLVVAISAAVEALPSVGRAHLARYGDGGAHLHLFFFGRPARAPQFRGSPLLDWSENWPMVPSEVLRANGEFVAERLAAAASQ